MNTCAPVSPLARLMDQPGVQLLDSAALAAWNANGVLFFTGISKGRKEAHDVAVAVSEMVKAYGGRIALAVVADGVEDGLRERFGIRVLPALVFIRDGTVMRALFGIRDWVDYTAAFAAYYGAP